MKTAIINFILLSLLLISYPVSGQNTLTASEIVSKASSRIIESSGYSYCIKYKYYNNYTTLIPTENFTGFMIKKNDSYYYKLKNTEFVGSKNLSIKANSDEKALLISESAESAPSTPMDIGQYLKGFKARLLKYEKGIYVCELIPNGNSQLLISKVELHINSGDFQIILQKIYYPNPLEHQGKAEKPRVEIHFSHRVSQKGDNLLLSEGRYIRRSGSDIKLTELYKGYKLFKA